MNIKYLFLGLGLSLLLILGVLFALPDNNLHLIFCDVGQGDAILVSRESQQILVDGGPNNKVLGCLSDNLPFWDRTIEMIVLTHPEADHLTGLISVLERYRVKQLISSSLVKDSPVFTEFRQRIIKNKIPVYSPKMGDQIKIAGLVLKILWPENKLGNEMVWRNEADLKVLGVEAFSGNFNQTAIVSQLSFGQFDALLTGDIGLSEEDQLPAEPVEVLKIAHHGSKYSTAAEFLEKIKPQLAVVSVGRNNYGHPSLEVLDRLTSRGIKFFRTDLNGELEIVSDGKGWWLERL